MKITWSPLAIERIAEIAEYIAKDNPEAADRWVDSVFQKVQRLKDFPNSGRRVPETGRIDILEILSGNYRIVYRIRQKEVAVLTVRHLKQILPHDDVLDEG